MKKKIRVGVIGTGVGLRSVIPGLVRTGRVEIVALSGSCIERVEELSSEFNIELLTGDYKQVCNSDLVDLICVCSPNEFHLEHGLAALESGCHVYLEKPIANNYADALKLKEAATQIKPDRLVVVGHQLRFSPFLQEMKAQILRGSIGKVYNLSIIQRGSGLADPKMNWTWEFDGPSGGGVRLAMGSHLVDLANYILDSSPVSLSANMDSVHPLRAPEGSDSVECAASIFFDALLSYPTSSVHLSSSAAVPGDFHFEVIAHGAEGVLKYDLDGGLSLSTLDGTVTDLVDSSIQEEYLARVGQTLFEKSFTYFAEQIVTAIDHNETTIEGACSLEDAVEYLKVLDGAKQAHDNHQSVRFGEGSSTECW